MNEMTVTLINERAAEEYFRRGVDSEKEANHEKAVEFFERTLSENPDHEQAAFHLAVLYDRRAEDAKAIELYEAHLHQSAGSHQRVDEPRDPV